MDISALLTKNMFRKVDSLVWNLLDGKIGQRTTNGIATFEAIAAIPPVAATATEPATPGEPASGQVSVNPFENFSKAIPAYAIKTALTEVKPEDLVYGAQGPLGWVVTARSASLQLMDREGHVKNYVPPKVEMLGIGSGVMVVRSLFNMFGQEGVAGLSNSLMPLLMMSGDGGLGELDEVLPLILFSGMNAQANGNSAAGAFGSVNPMMLMMLAGKKGNSNGGFGIKEMMMLQMFGGATASGGAAGGMNPMMLMMMMGDEGGGGLFGGSKGPRTLAVPELTRIG